ncbi:MAG: phosphate ABC transporter ATP-binding protein PstB [Candidatus Hydrothermales bacterium]
MAILKTENLNVYFGNNHVLKNINIEIPENKITAIMGPSGCGKSTLLRCFNRMNDLIDNFVLQGKVLFKGKNIYENSVEPSEIRTKIGMVFQKPNPFPKSIYENVAFGPKILGIKEKSKLDYIVEESLKKAYLWEEVKDKLRENALNLSGGQQQRLCIARALAVGPEVLLLDEPTSALDPVASKKIEELLEELKKSLTIVIVTHNPSQASRISDFTAFLYLGELIEFDTTDKIFTVPKHPKTQEYLSGKFG